jgi:hypothetical protein
MTAKDGEIDVGDDGIMMTIWRVSDWVRAEVS